MLMTVKDEFRGSLEDVNPRSVICMAVLSVNALVTDAIESNSKRLRTCPKWCRVLEDLGIQVRADPMSLSDT